MTFVARAVLVLIVLSGCSATEPGKVGGDRDAPGNSTGVTVFGDARIGVTFN